MSVRRLLVLLTLPLLLTALPSTAAHQTVYGTAATGSVTTWGVTNNVPDVCPPREIPCLEPCTDDIYWLTVTLTLLNPSPVDVVTLSVVGDPPGIAQGSLLYPSDVATYSDPVAEVTIQLGGCNRATTAVVHGVLVEGQVDYSLFF